ncbi:MAG: cytochrome C [Kiritimatiellae bacterium]|nr:cytochrome C [Kiritimatiellia bacterium]
MAQVFRPSANTIAKASIFFLMVLTIAGLCGLDLIHRSPYVRYTHRPKEQPVPFSHKHHVNMGIDCRYCHTTVEESASANIPSTRICMNCHSTIWKDSPMLEPVRESWQTGKSLEWNRVHDLPDFVYFNHSIHINKGIGCVTCHGPVDEMPLVHREKPLFMKWCLECHKAPEKFIRPQEEVFNMDYKEPKNQLELGRKLVKEYHVQNENNRLTDCWICHR